MQADMRNLKETLEEMRAQAAEDRAEQKQMLGAMDTRMRNVEDVILTARVSWRTLFVVGSAAATVGGILWGAYKYFQEPLTKLAKIIFGV